MSKLKIFKDIMCKLGFHNFIDEIDITNNGQFLVQKCIKCNKRRYVKIEDLKYEAIKHYHIAFANTMEADRINDFGMKNFYSGQCAALKEFFNIQESDLE